MQISQKVFFQLIAPSGETLAVSPELQKKFTHPGQKHYEVLFGRKTPFKDCPFEKVLQKKTPESFEYQPFPEYPVLRMDYFPLCDADGNVQYVYQEIYRADGKTLKTLHADSEAIQRAHKETSHALWEEREHTEHLQKNIEFQKTFLALAAHQLQQPVGLLKGHLELYADEQNPETLLLLQKEAHRLGELVNQLFALAEVELGTKKLNLLRIDIRQFIQQIYEEFKPKVHSHIFDVSLPEENDIPFYAKVDPQEMKEVVMSLLENAVKYVPEGKHITLGLRTGQKESVEIFVQDNGDGIPVEVQETLFDPFSRSKPHRAKGAGLGLTLAKRMVEMHTGSLWIESVSGEESTFIIQLPRILPTQED